MDNIFGIPMNTILIILGSIMAICFITVALIAVFNPIIFKMALRNPPRRKAQTVLIVIGLMLATLIVSAALTTGDTLDHSIKKITYDSLNRADITVGYVGDAGGQSTLSPSREPVPMSLADDLEQQFADNPDVEGVMPMLTVDVPVINQGEQLSEPSAIFTGLEWDEVAEVGGINAPDGSAIDLDAIGEGEAIVSETLATETRTEVGDEVEIFVNNQPHIVEIAAIGEDSILTGIEFGNQGPSGYGLAMAIDEVQEITGLEDQARFVVVTLAGGVEIDTGTSEEVEAQLEQALDGTPYGINPVKREAIASAEVAGSQFVSLFLVLGLFSIAAGVLLIFLIFMMLAAERRPEMGMARAVGMRQSSLVQQFISEGTLYDIGSALVGAIAGVGVAFVMVGIVNNLLGDFLSIEATFTLRSLAIAYALGVTVTFLTIIFASARAARLNVVSAIRDLPEPERQRERRPRWLWWRKIPRFGPRIPGIGMYVISLLFFPLEFIPNLLIYPIRFVIWVVRVIAHYIGWGPLLTPVGLLMMLGAWGISGESWSLALYSTGFSIFGLGMMLILERWFPRRIVFSAISLILLLWWLSPEDSALWNFFELFQPEELVGDFEMFFISGVMMVTFATLLIMWNAEIIVWLVGLFGRAFSRWVPAVKTAVAYPLASKTKTGLTLAMFSLIVFSMVTMSTLNANFIELFTTDQATAGWDVRLQTSANNPIDDLDGTLEEAGIDTGQFQAVGHISGIALDNSEIRLAEDEDEEPDWKRLPLNGVDSEYAQQTEMPLRLRAEGYESDEAVWDAIVNDPNVAVIDTFSGGPRQFGSEESMFFLGAEPVEPESELMEPVDVVIGDTGSSEDSTVTIIGVIDDEVSMAFGLYMNQGGLLDLYGNADLEQTFIQLDNPTVDEAESVARDIESSLLQYGVQAESTEAELETQAQIQTGFLDLIQGFMGLGLLVGIAALGVISFRAVVERRQQIGMLRAIGFQKSMIAATFLLESMVIATLGVLSGLALGLILSRNLLTAGDIGADFEQFIIPWTQLGVLLFVALGAAALMTIIPSRNAASVPVADALRYE